MGRVRKSGVVCAVMLSGFLAACSLLSPLPRPSTLVERLAALPTDNLPVEQEVVIHWDEHQIPYIEAKTDNDLAFALGLVHAHLRLGQMELLRHISQGRIAELAGPLATDIDHSLRILNFGRAAAEIEAALPAETRAWVENFVRGINHYQSRMTTLPQEFRVFNLEPRPWTVRDVLTAGRVASSDVNWLVWFRLLKLRRRDDWPQLWARLVRNGTESFASMERGGDLATLSGILGDFSRSGSNALAVSGGKTGTGAALMATDPHLGILVPNLWLIVGFKSPSHNAVGLMVPGLPFIAIGRNARIAWSGTNMRAASSDLYDVSWMPPGAFTERKETIKVRWWFDREITVRESEFGPVLSDAPALKYGDRPAFALKWMGHRATDEITAMLKASRAANWRDFRDAFTSFAVSAQNMLYADVDGNIGQVMAVQLPVRKRRPPDDMILDPRDESAQWDGILDVGDLPVSYNPKAGFLVSANNRPAEFKVPIGYFFSPDDRAKRMAEVLSATKGPIVAADLKALQRDVRMSSATALRDAILERVDGYGIAAAGPGERKVIELLRGWDGEYARDSRGAVAFELVFAPLLRAVYARRFGAEDGKTYTGAARIKALMIEDMGALDGDALKADLDAALSHAAARIDDFPDWGAMHRLQLSHPLSNLPLIGGRYRFADYPAAGSTDTLMKTAHGPVEGRHATRYGSNARFVTDLADPDANDFTLLGGQDGWMRSSTFLDQVTLWREGTYIRVPLRPETARATFPHKTVLRPE